MAAKKSTQPKAAVKKKTTVPTKRKSAAKGGGPVKKTTKQTSQKSTAARGASKARPQDDSILDEIIAIIIIVASIATIIALFTKKMGPVGVFLNSVLKGTFGFGAYFLPFVVILFCIWILFSERRMKAMKIVAAILFICTVSTLGHVFNFSIQGSGMKLLALYKAGTGANGGVLGGMFGNFLLSSVDRLGTYLILISLLLISIIMGTGMSFFRGIGHMAGYIGGSGKRKNEKIKAKAEMIKAREAEREMKERLRAEKVGRRREFFNINLDGKKAEESDILMDDILTTAAVPESFFDKDEPVIAEEVFEKAAQESTDEKIAKNNEIKIDETEEKSDKFFDFHKKTGIQSVIAHEGTSNIEEPSDVFSDDFIPIINQKLDTSTNTNTNTNTNTDMPEVSDVPDIGGIAIHDATFTEAIENNELPQVDSEKIIGAAIATEAAMAQGVMQNTEFTEQKIPEPKPEPKPEAIKEIVIPIKPEEKYVFPPVSLLGKDEKKAGVDSRAEMLATAKKLEETLKSFGVDAKVIQINKGPTVTRYELSPSQGVKVSKIVNLADDIALNLAASGIRIEAPIPGKAAVGIEVPNPEPQSVFLRSVLDSDLFRKFPSKLAFALGEDIAGNAVVTDIAKMPHLLIAGATGSGKSVCINTLITSIIYKADPSEVKLLLVDPKVVELSVYNGIPHLLIPVVTDPKKAAGALNWAVREMLARYNDFAEHNVRDIAGFNAMKKEKGEADLMPQIVIVIDELADLMMAAPGDVEDSICRLAQMARAAGLHLIIATQRPSVDVITGVIKANIPSRLAFAVSSGIDSRTILDMVGAEKLLGKGDMLFYPVGMSKPIRVQGAFVTDKEVENIVSFLKDRRNTDYDKDMIDKITAPLKSEAPGEEKDEFYEQAIKLVVEKEKASVSMLQRQFRIGYNRAARLMEDLESRGIVGPEDGSKPRRVLMSAMEYAEYLGNTEEEENEK